jgi:hypothetical protein
LDTTQEVVGCSTNEEVQSLLKQYTHIFEEPQGLPHHRQNDHAMPLKSGSEPPMIRLYGVPHKQKSEMENQVKHLLESSVSHHSNIPYASPAILVRKKDGTYMATMYRLQASKCPNYQRQVPDPSNRGPLQ